MRWPLLLGVLLIAIAAFLTLTWSQSASVRLQQQIMEMRAKAFMHEKTAGIWKMLMESIK